MSDENIGVGTKDRDNNFGLLRLLFAALVIVSHSPEMIDGNRSREFLTCLFGTISFGEVAVDGFFLISGYLITNSFDRRESTYSYFYKRIARIVPAYLVSFWLCVLCLAPFVSAGFGQGLSSIIMHGLLATVRLLPPNVPGAFHDLPYPVLNGPMWTIPYEFRCYIAAALIGSIGLYRLKNRAIYSYLVAGLVLLNITQIVYSTSGPFSTIIGDPYISVRFEAAFGLGSLHYVFRDRISYTLTKALIAGIALVICLFIPPIAETAFILLGGYIVFCFALKAPTSELSRISNKTDISYGLYLYAWPLQNLVIWHYPTISPWILCLATLAGASILAYASWVLIEKPSLSLFKTNPFAKRGDPRPQGHMTASQNASY